MRRLYEEQNERALLLVKHFSGATRVQIFPATKDFPACWECKLNINDGDWRALYIQGSDAGEFLSFIVWRIISLHGVQYREAVAQFTEVEHRGKGYGRHVLKIAAKGSPALMSDREGLSYPAFKLWNKFAKDHAVLLNIETGQKIPYGSLSPNQLWHSYEGCETWQTLFEISTTSDVD